MTLINSYIIFLIILVICLSLNIIFLVIANTEDDPEEEGPTPPAVPHINNDTTDRDSFDEIYKTYELTDFDRLLSTSVVRTGDNVVSLDSEGGAIQGNPFVVRDKMKKKVGR
ncbi:PREDICTED: uncharacterized protein LOC109589323 [Amphimedon queenslandica]|uniref:Uncharacterized protein n=1 Tax=Amphimedon queenslandica TaxID=400682 RepID=A0AAN0JVQ4_AMPQE|nr:PREDICTED: uncharacterized protein LOC109589323 [Amphimedon queenslandica]|eukprot:XP_019860986.1 PREDICTED: uncharacterized protein LOC109589323 [Amphimedon queenslandica]